MKNAIKKWLGIYNYSHDSGISFLSSNLVSLMQREINREERLCDIEKDIKLTWDYLGVTKEMIPAKEKSHKLVKRK